MAQFALELRRKFFRSGCRVAACWQAVATFTCAARRPGGEPFDRLTAGSILIREGLELVERRQPYTVSFILNAHWNNMHAAQGSVAPTWSRKLPTAAGTVPKT